jgi:hypothetical protein
MTMSTVQSTPDRGHFKPVLHVETVRDREHHEQQDDYSRTLKRRNFQDSITSASSEQLHERLPRRSVTTFGSNKASRVCGQDLRNLIASHHRLRATAREKKPPESFKRPERRPSPAGPTGCVRGSAS